MASNSSDDSEKKIPFCAGDEDPLLLTREGDMEIESPKKPLRILIVEDLESDADLMQYELQSAGIEFTSRRVETREAFTRTLEEFCPDLILADYSLPSFDGMSALGITRRQRPELPFIFVSGAMGEERAIELLREGATDYILKDRLSRLPSAVLRAMRDVQERKQRKAMEKKLRDSEEKYRSLVESTDDSIYMLDPSGVYLFANEKYLSRIGLSPEEVIGRPYGSFHTGRQEEELLSKLPQVIESGSSIQFEDSGAGDNRYYLRTLSPVRDPETGKVVSVTVISKDITERKYAEDVLKQAHSELENRVKERTAELAASNDLLKQEVEERKIAENALIKTNEELSSTIKELEIRNREIEILSETSSLLQACVSVQEAHQVIARSFQKLFSTESGSVYLLDSDKNLLETVVSWGKDSQEDQILEPKECWALRLGRPYLVESSRSELVCAHIKSLGVDYFDVPMTAQGETLGLLTLIFDPAWKSYPKETRERLIKHKQQLAIAVAEATALSLANFRLRETLYIQSMHDALTGLYNRRYLGELLNRELHRMARKGTPLGIMMLDIDFFKNINDTFGHEAGDVYLRELGAFLKGQVRTEDFACRYGGEEFVIVLPETYPEVVIQRAESLRKQINEMEIQYQGHSLGRKTVSIGIAVFPDNGDTVDQVLQKADIALYRAKVQGRNQVALFEP